MHETVPTNLSEARHHDIVIVGGGLVGASLAIALDGLGLDVAMVEATPGGGLPPVFDERNLSFAEATCNALRHLGVWERLHGAIGPIRRIHASRAGDFGQVLLDARAYGREAFGNVVIARDFGEALETRLATCTSLTRYRPARFIGTAQEDEGWRRVQLESAEGPRVLATRLLVGADGTGSAVREALGINAQVRDYGQTLFVCRMRCDRAPDGTAYERLRDDGPTALLPRGDRHYGVVHAVSTDEADAIEALDEVAWIARVQSAFGWRAGRFIAAGVRSRYAAKRVVAGALVAPRAVLLGNAAQTVHPVGAQGFNLGLRDALTLVECIQSTMGDAGGAHVLAEHVRRRTEDRTRTLQFSDGLARIGSSPSRLLRPLRSVGMAALGARSLQSTLVGGAMGYRGDVPALCLEAGA